MYLSEALGDVEELDPGRPLTIGPMQLGCEAAATAANILSGALELSIATLTPRAFGCPVYWSVDHAVDGHIEIFGFPRGWGGSLPTALEIALVKAIAFLPPEQHDLVFSGGTEVVIGSSSACLDFRKAASAAKNPMAGTTTAFDGCTSAVIDTRDAQKVGVALNCLLNSYSTSPLKFRFLELYRVMEALFLADVRNRLLLDFSAEPAVALSSALEALKSELKQITALAEPHAVLFEEIWTLLHGIKNNNRFTAALFRRLQTKNLANKKKWETGAALIYQIRCAVVHAGEKDMIFENFSDGDVVIDTILLTMERAALKMLGITLL